jgi:hypothetical protein
MDLHLMKCIQYCELLHVIKLNPTFFQTIKGGHTKVKPIIR